YGEGLARVRVEYVGRAPLDGSDDRTLMATLRHGSPAPAPSGVMVASVKPFAPPMDDSGKAAAAARPSGSPPVPGERPFTLGTPPPPPKVAAKPAAPQAPAVASGPSKVVALPVRARNDDAPAAGSGPAQAPSAAPALASAPRKVVTLPVRPRKDYAAAAGAAAGPAPNPPSSAAYAPAGMDGSSGLMSGGGLY